MVLDPSVAYLPYGGGADISGLVEFPGSTPGMVAILGQQAGSSAVTTLAMSAVDDEGAFDALIDGLTRNTLVTARYLGDDQTLPSQATRQFYVSAALGLKASKSTVRRGSSVTLSATILPASATGSVVFEYQSGKKWVTIASRPISLAKAACSWKVPKGRFTVRARYSGATNHGGTSKTILIRGT